MEQLSSILSATLSPDSAVRRQAERELIQFQSQDSFGPIVLQLCQDTTSGTNKAIRQSAALSFKNWIKANWAVSDEFQKVEKNERKSREKLTVYIAID
jgi:exportin-2 (importin alpha re-exporter)